MQQHEFKVLILEDNPTLRREYATQIGKVFDHALNKPFYKSTVDTVEDVDHFEVFMSRLSTKERIDLAIVDQKMKRWTEVEGKLEEVPDSDLELRQGEDVVLRFARDPRIRRMVVLTAFEEEHPEEKRYKQGAAEYWQKTETLSKMFQLQIESIFDLPSRYDVMRFDTALDDSIDEIVKRFKEDFIGEHRSMLKVKSQICEAALSDIPVLIVGETGTGKEEVAKLIHRFSSRGIKEGRALPIVLNCAEFIEEQLLRAELFGYTRGAFTGAVGKKEGRIQDADNSTLFLDEVGLASNTFQAVMLRAIQEGRAIPVGGTEKDLYEFNVRLIAATDQDVFGSDRFSKAFLHRLAGMVIEIPPLRDRNGDVLLLTERLLNSVAGNIRISYAGREFLKNYDWPGNVRQLKFLVKTLAERYQRTREPTVTRHDLEYLLPSTDRGGAKAADDSRFDRYTLAGLNSDEVRVRFMADFVNYQHRALTGGEKTGLAYSQTAQALGCSVSTVKERLGDYRRLFEVQDQNSENNE